jgi:hypothetical protein
MSLMCLRQAFVLEKTWRNSTIVFLVFPLLLWGLSEYRFKLQLSFVLRRLVAIMKKHAANT